MDPNFHVCKNHPDTVAHAQCAVCGEWFCRDCLVQQHGKLFCKSHASPQKLRKKRDPMSLFLIVFGALLLCFALFFAVKIRFFDDPVPEDTTPKIRRAVSLCEQSHELDDYVPLVTFDTITYTGSGEGQLIINEIPGAWVVYAECDGEGPFSITGYDPNGNLARFLVISSAPYAGTSIDASFVSTRIDVSASGNWRIEIRPLIDCDTIKVGDTLVSSGDSVLRIDGTPKTIEIHKDPYVTDFYAFTIGARYHFLADADTAANITKTCTDDPQYLIVSSSGEWSIQFNE